VSAIQALIPPPPTADPGVWRRKPDNTVALPDTAGTDAALAAGPQATRRLGELLSVTLTAMAAGKSARGGPLPPGGAPAVTAAVRTALGECVLPGHGVGAARALAALTQALTYGAADPADAQCAGHLHCPPLAVAAVADFVVSVLNPSLDSWDQAPAGSALEAEVISALASLAGYAPATAGGVLTTGGTESNLMGLLLARETAVRHGSPAGRWRVLCGELAHFSVTRNAALLGIGDDAVIRVATDRDWRMDPVALGAALDRVATRREVPIAVVATAGTTDFGTIDPLPQVARAATAHGAWLHVDAAYGGGALFSDQLAPLLSGLERADSLALDLHKLGWQPAPAGIFLVRDAATLAPLEQRAEYLNPADDEAAGLPSLLGRSLRTTRRPDAFKIAVTLRALGRDGLATLVDRCHDLAGYAAHAIDKHPHLILEAPPVLTSVVFRYRAGTDSDRVNAALRRRLLAEGRAVVGRTELLPSGTADSGTRPSGLRLKLTFLNPTTTRADVDGLLHVIAAAGQKEESC
jgi:L-2,4-diaminobutyrate decarboxylase